MHVAAAALDTEFMIMLEPDNTVHPVGITNVPTYDAGGLRDSNPRFGPPLVKFVEAQARKLPGKAAYKWWYRGTGLAGGTYFRTAAILDAFSDEAISQINWGHLLQYDSKRVFSSDFAMPIALAYRGYTYAPWTEIVQKDLPNQPLDGTWAFEHYGRGVVGGKPEYNRHLKDGQALLYTPGPREFLSHGLNCQLCWDPKAFKDTFGEEEANACANMNPVPCFTDQYSMWEGFKSGCTDPVGKGYRDPVTAEELVGVEP